MSNVNGPHTKEEPCSFIIVLKQEEVKKDESPEQILFYITTPPKAGVTVNKKKGTIEVADGSIERSVYEPHPITSYKTKCGATFSPPAQFVEKITRLDGTLLV